MSVTVKRAMAAHQPLIQLRQLLGKYNLHGYLIPSADAHQSEYIANCDARRGFISGFTGSAGFAVVTLDKAALWTDGRYFLQASQQLDQNHWTLMKQGLPDTPSIPAFLSSELPAKTRVGLDPQLMTIQQIEEWQKQLDGQVELVGIQDNLIDAVWANRPSRPANKVQILDLKFAGQSHIEKIGNVQKYLKEFKPESKKETLTASGLIVSALDEVAWLLNLRGSDIIYNPVFFAHAIVTPDKCLLYINPKQVDSDVELHLKKANVELRPYDAIYSDLKQGLLQTSAERKVLVTASTSLAVQDALGGAAAVKFVKSPIQKAKAIKNETECEGFRQCHLRDAAALCNYFGWLENELVANKNQKLSEVDVADRLEEFRKEQALFMGPSFDTISSVGPNGAIIHYKPHKETCALLDPKQVYLCDSGGQYKDGTTDVTRTLHFGEPTDFERDCFTRVLQGHINLATVVFPTGTTGYQLDVTARMDLWNAGLDYRHGTGHGVGSFLNVHEGPQGIGFRISFNDVPLEVGMTVTNEPGYYHEQHFGIRIENIMLVKVAETANRFGDKPYLGFENVTFVPIGLNLIKKSLFSEKERQYVNSYHKQCWEKVSPLLKESSLGWNWLKKETQPI